MNRSYHGGPLHHQQQDHSMPDVNVSHSMSSVGRLSAATVPVDTRPRRPVAAVTTAGSSQRRRRSSSSRRSVSPSSTCRYCYRRGAPPPPSMTCSSCGEDIDDDDGTTDTGRRPDTASSFESLTNGNGSSVETRKESGGNRRLATVSCHKRRVLDLICEFNVDLFHINSGLDN